MQWLVARLEDAWEDRLSGDAYLWRKDSFYQHLGLLLLRCLECTAFFCDRLSPSPCEHTSLCVGVYV